MEPKSEVIKEKIKNIKLNYKNKKYIEELLDLEDYIVNVVHSMGGNYLYHDLKDRYKKEWKEIYLELKPKVFKQIIEREKKEKEKEKIEEAKMRLEEIKEEKEYKKEFKTMWKEYGGNL